MERAQAAVPGTTPWVAIASAKAFSRTLPSATIVPASSQQTSETESEPLTAVLAKAGPSPTGPGPGGTGLVQLTRGGLGPQVDLGPVRLHLPPDGEHADAQQGKDEQLLHGETFRSDDGNANAAEPGGGSVDRRQPSNIHRHYGQGQSRC